jgi:hypothetical protein
MFNDFSKTDLLLRDHISTTVIFLDWFLINNNFPFVCNFKPTYFRLNNKNVALLNNLHVGGNCYLL